MTGYENPFLTFAQLGLEYAEIEVLDDRYNLYRNGNLIEGDLNLPEYDDYYLEGGMEYFYRVSASNLLDIPDSESNVSTGDLVSTENFSGMPPVFQQNVIDYLTSSDNLHAIQEDGIWNLSEGSETFTLEGGWAVDPDGDEISYFCEPLIGDSPISCSIGSSEGLLNMILTPAPNYFGVFDIALYAFDDYNSFEYNTLSDTVIFPFTVQSVNDAPLRINYIDDLILQQADFCIDSDCPYVIDLHNYIIDVDELIMNEETLVYEVQMLQGENITYSLSSNMLSLDFLDIGTSLISITATDQEGISIQDEFSIIVEDILNAEELNPESFRLNDVYPNPFNPIVYFDVEIPYNSMLTIEVYNLLGQKVDMVYDGFIEPGIHNMNWIPESLPSGLYFLNMKTENFINTKKMILLK